MSPYRWPLRGSRQAGELIEYCLASSVGESAPLIRARSPVRARRKALGWRCGSSRGAFATQGRNQRWFVQLLPAVGTASLRHPHLLSRTVGTHTTECALVLWFDSAARHRVPCDHPDRATYPPQQLGFFGGGALEPGHHRGVAGGKRAATWGDTAPTPQPPKGKDTSWKKTKPPA